MVRAANGTLIAPFLLVLIYRLAFQRPATGDAVPTMIASRYFVLRAVVRVPQSA